jgi:glycosyltransferase involved in cell wall biosynthesis
MERKLNVLISAYACGPNWGSEIGMGWNWIIHLSEYCQLTVITESDFKKDIEETLPTLNLKYIPNFYYIDIGSKGRELFWKQGSFRFYHYYNKWQFKAFDLAREIIKTHRFDLIHQLNMIGFREPGYLWKISNIPFVWGPVGGYNQFPISFLPMLDTKNILYYVLKNVINNIQIIALKRPKNAASRADLVFASTKESMNNLKKISRNMPSLMNETGCKNELEVISKKTADVLRIIWVGKLQGLKALPIALYSLSKIKTQIRFRLTIIGDGPDEINLKKIAMKLGISQYCSWQGKVSNQDVINSMRENDVLLFTSLKEGTPHVVMEAIENGLPVICHDACGHGASITSQCGIKIPMKNLKSSISDFSNALYRIAQDPELLNELSKGAHKRANELTWNSKAQKMFERYTQLIKDDKYTQKH